MTVVLGVDGGGTKTHAIVADTTGRILGASVSGPSNWERVGLFPAGRTLREAVEGALSSAGVAARDLAASVFGLAGVDWPSDVPRIQSVIHPIGLGGDREILNDSFVALRAGTTRRWGLVVIAGSGSIVAGRNESEAVFRMLGLDRAFGEFGSGVDVSDEAIGAVARAYTGAGPATALTELLCEAAGCTSVDELLERLGRKQLQNRGFESGRLAPLVVSAAERSDMVARDILLHAGKSLGETAAHVARRLSMEGTDFEVVLAGGLFRSGNPVLLAAFDAALRQTAPRAKHAPLDALPVVGALLMAMELVTGESHEPVHSSVASSAARALQAA